MSDSLDLSLPTYYLPTAPCHQFLYLWPTPPGSLHQMVYSDLGTWGQVCPQTCQQWDMLRKVGSCARNSQVWGGANGSPLREGRRLALPHPHQLHALMGDKPLGFASEPPAIVRSSTLSDSKALKTPGQLLVGWNISWAHARMESLGEPQRPEGPPKERPRCSVLPLVPQSPLSTHRYGLISASHSQVSSSPLYRQGGQV